MQALVSDPDFTLYLQRGWMNHTGVKNDVGRKRGRRVLDSFAGSGTTAIAARKLGRLSVAIERDHAYAKLAKRRLRHAARQQLSLLAEPA